LLALIAAFSEVSGEAAYEVSVMHLGAIGARLSITIGFYIHILSILSCV